MPNGAFRLFLGSSLYLQVALALVTWELVQRPRRAWPWLLFLISWIDVIATYARGVWIGALIAFVLVIALGSQSLRRAVGVVTASLVLFGTASLGASALHRSLPNYLLSRGTSATSTGEANFSRTLVDGGFERGLTVRDASWAFVDSQDRSLSVRLTPGGRSARSLALRNTAGNQDDYAAQAIALKPSTRYEVSGWLDASEVTAPAASSRGLMVWDVGGNVVSAPITVASKGWIKLVIPFETGERPTAIQVRLYAPRGVVRWDNIRLAKAPRSAVSSTPVQEQRIPPRPAVAAEVASTSQRDLAGEVSNSIRAEQARVLGRHIADRPIFGSGFGSIARDYPYGTSYSYELSYFDLLFKAGVVGLLLFLSFPLRLVWDAAQARLGRLATPSGVEPRETCVVIAIVLSVLVVGATNPFLFAAFGILPILMGIAWLDAQSERG
jgi:hypothetical protein